MNLTPAQLATLKAAILANTNAIPAGQPFAGVQVKDVPNNSDGNLAVAGWYNQTAAPQFVVWRDVPMEAVLNAYTPANMTPVDAVPTTPQLTVTVYQARAQACQCKQINFQNLTLGRSVAPMKRSGYRAGLQDCLTNIPSGANGALLAANWVAVRDAAKFDARYIEAMFATGTGSSATPGDLVVEGLLDAASVGAALNLP